MDNLKVISHKGNRIITKEDLVGLHGIDETKWELVNLIANVWEQAQAGKDGIPKIVQLHQVKGTFKPIHQLVLYEDMLKELFAKEIPPLTDKITKLSTKKTQGDVMAILFHTDKHIDRIEHNSKYLNQINDRTKELIHQIKKWDIDKFVYTELGDMFNTNTNYTTKKFTQQRNNITEAESFKLGMHNEMKLINHMQEEFGEVDAVYVGGNHDQDKQNWMAQALKLYFSNNPGVNIDDRDIMRKYIEYGKSVVGLQHGHLVPRNRALETFASESKLKDKNYLIQGHIHHEFAKQYGKLLVESLGSPANPSERERENGYSNIGNIKAMLFDKKKGRIATLEG